MRGPSTMAFKQGFLKNLLLSLQACSSSPMAMGLEGRKRAIRSSAAIAMATAARGSRARWPQALLASPSPPCKAPATTKVQRCKKIVRRCCHRRRHDGIVSASLARSAAMSSSEVVARKLVRKRTKILRRMIPGGESLDEISLLREAMDYVAHLHAQVDVLRRISKAVQ
ncbi:hypothetical protein ACP4OV_009802 [Aristida adscensionis]